MRLRPGDQLTCSNPQCRLQVIVTAGGNEEEGIAVMTCLCGYAMKRAGVGTPTNKLNLTRGTGSLRPGPAPRNGQR
ncbi:MAG TPA: hypothetical protein VMH89_14300 [Candidatus Acidoferrum sp.]|nr:hypothetical protein [Candidatus Acidoferrum sp.]